MNPDKKVRRLQGLLYTSGVGTILFSLWSGIRGIESLFEIWNELSQLAMHVLADTWAHAYFAGTPSQVINNTDFEFFEVMNKDNNPCYERHVTFHHNPVGTDNLEKGIYINSMNDGSENSVMNLGHGRAGHLPDYSFIHYKYQPAWGNYDVIDKNNPKEYEKAFCQMIYAMTYLRRKYI